MNEKACYVPMAKQAVRVPEIAHNINLERERNPQKGISIPPPVSMMMRRGVKGSVAGGA